MSFNEFQNDVNNLMDILFGGGVASHATIIEQLNYLMFLRALTKKDDNAIALDTDAERMFDGELAKYRWDNLLMLNAEALFTTLENVFRHLPEWTTDKTIQQLFRDAHIKVFDKPTLRRVVHEIDRMMSDMDKEFAGGHTDVFGDMYEHLLSKMSQAGTLGQFRTPRHIINFIVDVIDPVKGETILDPACGTAGFLISALKHLKEKYTSDEYKADNRLTLDLLKPEERQFLFNNTFTGFDSDFDMFKFGLMNLYLHHLEHPNLKRQNTLVDTAGDRTKWDVILANPPFAGALDKDSISEDLRMGTSATEVLFLKYIIDHLSQNGRAGVIVPEGVLTTGSNAYKKIRKLLLENAGLWCVVSLPAGVFNPYAGVKTSILFFDKKLVNKNDEIIFIKIENDGFDLGAQRKPIDKNDLPEALEFINNWKSGNKEELKFVFKVEKNRILDDGQFNLRGEIYHDSIIGLSSKWEMKSISELEQLGEIELLRGQGISKKDICQDGKYKCIHYGEIYTRYKEIIDDVKSTTNIKGKVLSMIGDVLVPATTTADALGISVARSLHEADVIIGGDINIVRTRNKVVLSDFLAYLISYPPLKLELAKYAKGINIVHLSNNDIRKLKIIIPPLEVQEQIVAELNELERTIKQKETEISKLKLSISEKVKEVWSE